MGWHTVAATAVRRRHFRDGYGWCVPVSIERGLILGPWVRFRKKVATRTETNHSQPYVQVSSRFPRRKRTCKQKVENCNRNWGTCIAPTILEDWGHITESICILVPVNRMKEKCFQITTKQSVDRSSFSSVGSLFHARDAGCSNRNGSVANSSTCPRHDEVATRWRRKNRVFAVTIRNGDCGTQVKHRFPEFWIWPHPYTANVPKCPSADSWTGRPCRQFHADW